MEALQQTTERIPPTGLVWAIMGEIMRERNDLTLAQQYLSEGIELSRRGGIIDDLRHAYVYLIRLRYSQKDWQGVRHALQQGAMIFQPYHQTGVTLLSTTLEVRYLLTEHNIAVASQWANEFEHKRSMESTEYLQEFEMLTLAHIKLAQQQYKEAVQVLEEIILGTQESLHVATVIEAHALNALALWHLKPKADAEASLKKAIIMAQPQGYMRIFLDVGKSMHDILSSIHFEEPILQDYCNCIVNAFQLELWPAKISLQKESISNTKEPLTTQEQKILQMLANGLSNRDIANELVITLGTAKWHVHNIYEKLGVNSRVQAIIVARKQELI